jgi:acyl carrier protein
MLTQDQIQTVLRDALVELFDIEPSRITASAQLQDLEIDSIDAIDLIDHIRRSTGCKLAAEDFHRVRTVQDVIDVVLSNQDVAP